MEDITPPSAGLPGSHVHGDPNNPLALLDDFQDKFGRNLTELENQQTLSNFYKGSPPKWISYYISEEQNTPLVKRNGYNHILKQIKKCQEMNRIFSSINLFHQPGSGGSTLAMQILWDLRKDFKCATIKPVNAETAVIADHIIKLFQEGGSNDRRTLLLLDDNVSEEDLMESLNMEIAKQEINATVPMAILLNTKRKPTIVAEDLLSLRNKLSDEELNNFKLKETEMKLTYSDEEFKMFHGFNLMKNNFDNKYVASLSSIKEIKDYVKRNKPTCNTELFSVLALLNSYVPGSFLPLSRCLDFLNPRYTSSQQTSDEQITTLQDPPHMIPGTNMALEVPPDTNTEQLQFEKDMEPFMKLIVVFSRDEMKSECVRLAHPMIANECLKILAEAGITKGEIAKRFLECCKPNEPPYMVKMIKSMLIKREIVEENQEMFSRLILDIKDEGDLKMCEELFEIATTTFEKDPFFPQTFARFLYIVLHKFDEAEHQARAAIVRDPQNSFLRDTLGQIHKNHLRTHMKKRSPIAKFLDVARLAIRAFRDGEDAAENEQDPNTSNVQTKKVSHAFNYRGLFGYIQVAKIIFDTLTSLNRKWYGVLTGEESILVLPKAEDVLDYEDLIVKLQVNVERKHAFFESYLIYSKPSRYKSEPTYIQRDVDMCYSKYLLQHSKPSRSFHSIMDRSFPGLFSCLDRGYCSNFLERITEHTRKKHEEQMSDVNAAMNYVLSNIVLSNKDETSQVLRTLTDLRGILWRFVEKIYQSPEFFFLVLLLFWPNEPQHQHLHFTVDLNSIVENMKTAFDQKYKKYFRSRNLRPLFFLGQDTGLKRLVHSWKVHSLHTKHRKNPEQKRKTWAELDWGNEQLWEDSDIQNLLLRVHGVFRKQQLFAYVEDKEIAIYSDQAFVSYQGPASFFLGFTIKGPVAYDIKFEQDGEGAHADKFMESKEDLDQHRPLPACCTCADLQDLAWKQLRPKVWNEDGELTVIGSEKQECYRISSPAGSYECSVTGLRWVSDGDVSLMYHFTDWEPYIEDLKRMQYEPCGPLIDITIISGVLNEVHLPHFACLGSSPSLNDQVRVLDVQDSGMFLETCELTRFHAKLLHPTFSPKGFLARTGFPVKVHCEVLIYQTLIAHLTLHIYLVPYDAKIIQDVDKKEKEKDVVKIPKPGPERSLQMRSCYTIETKKENEDFSSKIKPERLKLRHSPIKYSEIYIKSAKDDFELHLINEENKSIWDVEIRAEEYGSTSNFPDRQTDPSKEYAVWFVNNHRNILIQRVSLVTPIADDLKSLLGGEKYSIITKCKTPQEQMRKIYSFLSGGQKIEEKFYLSLLKNEPHLVGELAEGEAV